ncbi:MAG: replication initiator protein A [Bdellovibrionota bacterium]
MTANATDNNSTNRTNSGAVYISRDEMNLAEFPLSVLSTRVNPNLKTLEFSDTVKGKNGDLVNRQWIITGADKFGLPTSSDDEVMLGLLKLTVNDGFSSSKVYFTRYELLKILRWTTEGRSYSRLQNALDRLSGVRIKATNAFYDNEAKSHSTRNFGLIDSYEINDGRDAGHKPSFFEWSEVLFKSFQNGFIKKLDLDFFLSLNSAVSKRLYRFLDKHFWYKGTLKFNLFVLAHEKIGVSRNYKYASSIKQQLDPALEELKNNGFIDSFTYEGRGKYTEIIIKAASKVPRSLEKKQKDAVNKISDLPEELGDTLLERVQNSLIARGLKEVQLPRLLSGARGEDLKRMLEIIAHFDRLVRTGSRLVSKSPVGFLYRAIERPNDFVLPGESKDKSSQAGLFDSKKSERVQQIQTTRKEDDALIKQYESWKLSKAKSYRLEVEPKILDELTQEAEAALKTMKGLISAENFTRALNHQIDEKLMDMFAVPSFEEWKQLIRH